MEVLMSAQVIQFRQREPKEMVLPVEKPCPGPGWRLQDGNNWFNKWVRS
jgi:hypothetical protein